MRGRGAPHRGLVNGRTVFLFGSTQRLFLLRHGRLFGYRFLRKEQVQVVEPRGQLRRIPFGTGQLRRGRLGARLL
jgi:hypothetical protein